MVSGEDAAELIPVNTHRTVPWTEKYAGRTLSSLIVWVIPSGCGGNTDKPARLTTHISFSSDINILQLLLISQSESAKKRTRVTFVVYKNKYCFQEVKQAHVSVSEKITTRKNRSVTKPRRWRQHDYHIVITFTSIRGYPPKRSRDSFIM
jgi:hypothetical protein